ncbi:MAG: hypothetical protein LBP62_01075 [Clostridiales bacterium]|nr:hypothetical protein [Clostridiales bacterium]
MTFKSNLSYAEFTEKFGENARERQFYNIKFGANAFSVKRYGDRTFAIRGKIIENTPLKITFRDVFAIRFAALFVILMVFVVINKYMTAPTAASLSAAALTALFTAAKARANETARMLIHDFKLSPVLDKDKYYILYNYFPFYLIIIFFLIAPAAALVDSILHNMNVSAPVALGIAIAAIAYLCVTKNFTEIFIVDREGIVRQNVFISKDKLFYSAENIESITVENKNLKGEEKEGAFSFEIKLKENALYRPESKFPKIKEKRGIYLPFNKMTAEIIKEKLGFDTDTVNYDEYYK